MFRHLLVCILLLPAAAHAEGLAGRWSPADADPPRCADEGLEGQTLTIDREGFTLGEVHCRFAKEAPEGFTAVKGRVACEVEGTTVEDTVHMGLEAGVLLRNFDLPDVPPVPYRRCP